MEPIDMDDSILDGFKREPPREFTERLRARLQTIPSRAVVRDERAWLTRKALVAAVAIVGVVSLFTIPAVRASAQAFLDMFRVVNFVAIPVERERVERLRSEQLDLPHLIGEQVTVLTDSGPPLPVTSVEAAAAASGTDVRIPSSLPPESMVRSIKVSGSRALRVTASTDHLRRLLESLSINDVDVPPALEGKTATIQVPPVIEIMYDRGERYFVLLQARSPMVSLPAGIDLPRLGEIGLRILGLDAAEAQRMASDIDWHSTVLVPVPYDATSLNHVQVGDARALAIDAPVRRAADGRIEGARRIIWSSGGRVFAVEGNVAMNDLLEVANSVR
jgi:hypothetical protein